MTLNELQILLAMNGNERIEYAENEIFANVELYTCYLESICSKYSWFCYYNKVKVGELAWLAYKYARVVIEGRWLEAESIIASDPEWALYYAFNTIKGRFPEGEAAIARVSYFASCYNADFGTKL